MVYENIENKTLIFWTVPVSLTSNRTYFTLLCMQYEIGDVNHSLNLLFKNYKNMRQ